MNRVDEVAPSIVMVEARVVDDPDVEVLEARLLVVVSDSPEVHAEIANRATTSSL